MMPSISNNTTPDITGSSTASGSAAKPAANSTDSLANKSTFLTLLVAQIKNQDPTQPQDGIQFVSQLAQFSQLEQSITANTTLGTMNTALGSANTELGAIQGLLTNTGTSSPSVATGASSDSSSITTKPGQ